MAAGDEKESESVYDAFISYTKRDYSSAERIAISLEEKGLRCWLAPRDVRPGKEYGEEIIRGITLSKFFVLLLSEAANMSASVKREVERAATKLKPIYPIRVEDVPACPTLEYFISMHQWIDAWPVLLESHIDRLVDAMQSEEQWIGNRLVRRRRLSLVAVIAICAALLGTLVIFIPEIRSSFQSEQAQARAELKNMGLGIDTKSLVSTLVSGDIGSLQLLTRAGLNTGQVAEALSQAYGTPARSVARLFCEKSRKSTAASAWLSHFLDVGLDANLRDFNNYYSEQSILADCLFAGNAEISLTLLRHGAFPHTYQDILFTAYPTTIFLCPVCYLVLNEKFAKSEKGELAAAFRANGAVFFRPGEPDPRGMTTLQARSFDEASRDAEQAIGFDIPTSPPRSEKHDTTVCSLAFAQTKTDWCAIDRQVPNSLKLKNGHTVRGLYAFTIRNMIAADKDFAYYAGIENPDMKQPWGLPDTIMIVVARDNRTWRILRHKGEGAGQGFCKKLENDKDPPQYCWRETTMRYSEQSGTAVTEDEDTFEVNNHS